MEAKPVFLIFIPQDYFPPYPVFLHINAEHSLWVLNVGEGTARPTVVEF